MTYNDAKNVQEPELTPEEVRLPLPLTQAVTQVSVTIILLPSRKFKFHFPLFLSFLVIPKSFYTTQQFKLF